MTLIRQWQEDDYTLKLFDYNNSYHGKPSLDYLFYYGRNIIFRGDSFCPSLLHDFSSDKTVAALLGFLSLKPGDTDLEYFDNYTPQQLAFVIRHGEYLSLLASDLESK